MRVMRVFTVGVFLAFIGLLSGIVQDVRDAQAIPAFARKYDFACSVCHVPSFPKLNDFGNLFRDHGYQLGTDQELPTWEGLTKGYWPVSFRTTVGYQNQSTGGLANTTNALAPGGQDVTATSGSFGFTGLDILSFGILNRDITFGMVFTPFLSSAAFGTGANINDSNLESAFIKLDNLQRFLGGSANAYLMNLKVGKFELDLPFSEKRSPTLNTAFLAYHYNSFTPTIGGFAPALTNPNDFGLGDNHPGIEMAGITPTPGGGFFRYSLAGISNSDVNTGNTGGGRAFQFYGRASQSVGGYGVVSGQRIGVYGIHGQVPTTPNAAGIAGGTGENSQSFSRVGVDASLTWGGQVNLFGTWMVAQDSRNMFLGNPAVTGTAQTARWNGGFVEADYNPVQLPKWLFIYRYDWITNTQQPESVITPVPANGVLVPGNFNNLQGHTAAIRYNFMFTNRTDIALHLEYNHLTNRHTAASGGDATQNTTLVGFDFAF